jgi:hypothetical protein
VGEAKIGGGSSPVNPFDRPISKVNWLLAVIIEIRREFGLIGSGPFVSVKLGKARQTFKSRESSGIGRGGGASINKAPLGSGELVGAQGNYREPVALVGAGYGVRGQGLACRRGGGESACAPVILSRFRRKRSAPSLCN